MVPLDPDDVSDMVVFASVAEHASFTAAAEAMGLAKSAVSARVARLERRLGLRLLHRTSRRVVLTPAGAEVYPSCARVARAAVEAREAAMGETEAPRGRLRVNAPVAFGQRWLVGPIARFVEGHPAVHLDIVLQDDVVDVAGGAWDVVIRIGAARETELVARRFASDSVVCVASEAYLARHGAPKRPLELAHHVCLRYGNIPRDAEWTFGECEGEPPVPVSGPVTSSDGSLLGALAEAGAGLAMAPWHIVGEAVRQGRLVRVLSELTPGELPVYAVHGRRPAAKVRAFVDHLVEQFRVLPWGAPQA
jgi:DNA-binding transcriptional LysR family regulator